MMKGKTGRRRESSPKTLTGENEERLRTPPRERAVEREKSLLDEERQLAGTEMSKVPEGKFQKRKGLYAQRKSRNRDPKKPEEKPFVVNLRGKGTSTLEGNALDQDRSAREKFLFRETGGRSARMFGKDRSRVFDFFGGGKGLKREEGFDRRPTESAPRCRKSRRSFRGKDRRKKGPIYLGNR